MKIKLLNDGGYAGLSQVKFPVVVEAEEVSDIEKELYTYHYRVDIDELIRVGGLGGLLRGLEFVVFLQDEAEKVSDNE